MGNMNRRAKVLMTATELAQHLDGGRPVTILDVRWQLSEPDGRAAYERGHLPGAVYVSLEDELTDHTCRQAVAAIRCRRDARSRRRPAGGASGRACR